MRFSINTVRFEYRLRICYHFETLHLASRATSLISRGERRNWKNLVTPSSPTRKSRRNNDGYEGKTHRDAAREQGRSISIPVSSRQSRRQRVLHGLPSIRQWRISIVRQRHHSGHDRSSLPFWWIYFVSFCFRGNWPERVGVWDGGIWPRRNDSNTL